MTALTAEQIDALKGMIQRRTENTGESRKEACAHISNYFINALSLRTGGEGI